MFSSSPVGLSAHSDVLDAPSPSDPAQRVTLLEELKRRGKASVIAQRWPDAVALYQKALDVADTEEEKAILNSNIALAQGKMGKWQESFDAATAAVGFDSTYVKGWWRLGQAHTILGRHSDAIDSFEKALKVDPGNKALQKEIEKVRVAAKTAKETKPPPPPKVEKAEPLHKKGPTIATKSTKSEKTAKGESLTEVDDETTFTTSDHVKGYKIVNGKKTSFFHNELTEDAAKLIGSIAPKKIDGSVAREEAPAPANGVSAWNKAGTWEEKDCTTWAKDALQEKLLASSTGDWRITKVEIGSGHASIATVRGKKRYIFEMEDVVVEWDFSDGDAVGKLRVAGFDGTDDEYEFLEFTVTTSDNNELQNQLKRPSSQLALREGIQRSIGEWVKSFHNTF